MKLTKGKWLIKEGRWENLKYGQWRFSTWRCRVFGHDFCDPRILPEIIATEPQTWEKCTECGYERKLPK